MVATGCTTQEASNEETRWIDAWVRWERGSKEVYCNDDDDDDDDDVDGVQERSTSDDDDESSFELAATPTDTFSFRYELCPHRADHHQKGCCVVDIELHGFPFESEQTWNSTGLTLWRSSEHLCDYLVEQCKTTTATTTGGNSCLFTEKHRFLELGSGLGRSGILAHHSLVLSSTEDPSNNYTTTTTKDDDADDSDTNQNRRKLLCLTDGDTNVLQQLRANIERNRPKQHGDDDANSNNNNHRVTVSCSQLLWGRETALAFLKTDIVDNRPFDVLFGSDLVYVAKVIGPLFETVATLLSKSSGSRFLMAHCARHRQGMNEVNINMVLEAAVSVGLEHKVLKEDGDISLFEFRWKEY